jgi:hypothetical protein
LGARLALQACQKVLSLSSFLKQCFEMTLSKGPYDPLVSGFYFLTQKLGSGE